MIYVTLILFLGLWFRLFQLQILQSEKYQEKSEANSIRIVEEVPGRSLICDRRGKVIVEMCIGRTGNVTGQPRFPALAGIRKFEPAIDSDTAAVAKEGVKLRCRYQYVLRHRCSPNGL